MCICRTQLSTLKWGSFIYFISNPKVQCKQNLQNPKPNF
jgi:hypothetical protein